MIKLVLKVVMAAFYIFSGFNHFRDPGFYLNIMPAVGHGRFSHRATFVQARRRAGRLDRAARKAHETACRTVLFPDGRGTTDKSS